ncbi:MAG: dolichol-P-glucose synthetase [Blastocatellia bacterium]|nr:MAG: dolichol-P-glucose synthetase [Blastocatellia bacterium]
MNNKVAAPALDSPWPFGIATDSSQYSRPLQSPNALRTDDESHEPCELSIVMPCLNEAETLEVCIQKARGFLETHAVDGEVLIADNGSTDGSQEIARRAGARVVDVPMKGYGSALLAGIRSARGRFVIMGDADDSYDFVNLMPFVEKLREGHDLVMGNRFRGGIMPNAMPPLHKYLGNPVLSFIGNLLFKSPCKDFHCGLRGFSKAAAMEINLRTTGMEFASEMVVKMTLHRKRIAEVPTILSKDGRSRPPHLRSWSDGWRHLRFLLLYSPRWLFFYPGLTLLVMGLLSWLYLLPGPQLIEGIRLDVHTLLYGALAITLGYQSIVFAVFTKVFAASEGLLPVDDRLDKRLSQVSLEKGLVSGGIVVLLGLAGTVLAMANWESRGFGLLNPSETLRVVIPSVTAIALGFETLLSSLFLSVLQLKRR